MIVSFHPIYTADQNIICAGRLPDHSDLEIIRNADAVILPQGCSKALYGMAREYCRHVFPNYDMRFDYPGKLGQTRLFQTLGIPMPRTETYLSVSRFGSTRSSIPFPLVIKLKWGGEGETIFMAENQKSLDRVLERVAAFERSGQKGFIVQQWIPSLNRSLRVVVIGRHIESYWRVQPQPGQFSTAVSAGAHIDHDADPHLQEAGCAAAARIRRHTGLQLAGFDFIFDSRNVDKTEPLILEINHFFGRKGLGGSDRFYHLLVQEIDAWLLRRNLKMGRATPPRGTV